MMSESISRQSFIKLFPDILNLPVSRHSSIPLVANIRTKYQYWKKKKHDSPYTNEVLTVRIPFLNRLQNQCSSVLYCIFWVHTYIYTSSEQQLTWIDLVISVWPHEVHADETAEPPPGRGLVDNVRGTKGHPRLQIYSGFNNLLQVGLPSPNGQWTMCFSFLPLSPQSSSPLLTLTHSPRQTFNPTSLNHIQRNREIYHPCVLPVQCLARPKGI